MEAEHGEQAHDPLRDAMARRGQRVVLRDVGVREGVEAAADPIEAAALLQARERHAGDALGDHVAGAEDAPFAGEGQVQR